MATFPGATPSFAGFTSSHTLSQDQHASQHNSEQAEIIALANKIGTGASTPTSGLFLRGNGVGTSAWAQVTLTSDVTGVLPQINGGTGTTLATGSGKAVYDTSPTLSSPTLTTPVIASFTSSQHNHQNSAGGGVLTAAALPALDFSLQTLSNPYKFSAYRNAAWTTTASYAKVGFDAEEYDTNSAFDSTVNNRYTAQVAGFYHFSWCIDQGSTASGNVMGSKLYKNGAAAKEGSAFVQGGATNIATNPGSCDIQLAAGDYVEIWAIGSTAAGNVGADKTYFSGHLISTT